MTYRLLFVAIGLMAAFAGRAQTDSLLVKAEAAYSNGEFTEAIDLYNKVVQTRGASAEIYYNLGNAYYKANQIAPAILWYERALSIDPGDADIRFTLDMARQRTVDKIEPVGGFFLSNLMQDIRHFGAADSWAKLGIVSFFLLLACLCLFFFIRNLRLRKAGLYLGLVMLAACVVANVFAHYQNEEMTNHSAGIVFTPTVSIKSSPDRSGTDLFVLHEGTKVRIKSSVGEWNEIELEDGNVGWMPAKDIERI